MSKIKLLFLSLAVMSGLFFQSCSSDNTDTQVASAKAMRTLSTPKYKDMLPEYFDFVGEAHNEGLDHVFYNAIQGNAKLTLTDVSNAAIDYTENVNIYTKGYDANYDDSWLKKSHESKSILIDGHDYSNFTTNELEYIKKLEDAIDNNKDDYDTALKTIKSLNDEIYYSDLEDNEMARLYMINSVASHSIQYWTDGKKSDKWNLTFQPGFNPTPDPAQPVTMSIDWGNVAKSDIAGFVLTCGAGFVPGAMQGAITLGLASGGIGALPGAIIGACAGATAAGIAGAVKASGAWLAGEVIYDWWNS